MEGIKNKLTGDLSIAERNDILEKATTSDIQETLANIGVAMKGVEAKRSEEEQQRRNELSAEIVDDISDETGRQELAEHQKWEEIKKMHTEKDQLLDLEDSFFKKILNKLFKPSSYTVTGEFVITNAGQQLSIVENKKKEKFVCVEVIHAGGDPGYQWKEMHYIEYQKVLPFIQ